MVYLIASVLLLAFSNSYNKVHVLFLVISGLPQGIGCQL